jgi:lathosterol oxidase
MDIALELCDTFFFDYAYSAILPARPAPYLLQNGFGNSTVEALKVASSWKYTPASKYLSWTPRDAAWMSQLPRDNAYRQFFSLFLIMWYVRPWNALMSVC